MVREIPRKEERQIAGFSRTRLHLDFHNHPLVRGVGKEFRSEHFGKCLRELGTDSVVLFAKCHHGMSYYPTAVGKPHPGMKGDLLSAQVEACEAEGIEYHLYFSVLRENYAYDHFPDWRYIGPDGNPSDPGNEYRLVCINTGYYDDYLKPQIMEALDRYPGAAGVWLDIIRYRGNACWCPDCKAGAERAGLCPQEFNQRMLLEKYGDVRRLLQEREKELTLNSIVFFGNQEWRSLTPLEIESILAHVGPFHFPLYSRYLSRCDCEKYGITHSFYQNWREYGTVKHERQLHYEVCQMVFAGFGVSLGDQLEPDGTFDTRRFPVLKSAYRLADRLDEVCDLSLRPISEVAIVASRSEAVQEDGQAKGSRDEFVRGALKLLLELHYQVAVIDPEEDFTPHKLLVLEPRLFERDKLAQRLEKYLDSGGRVLIMGTAGSKALEWLGLERVGQGNASYQYLELEPGRRQLVKSRGDRLKSSGKLQPTMESLLPYGDEELGDRQRDSLRPPDPAAVFPSVFMDDTGTVLYSSADFLSDHYRRGDWSLREVFERFLKLLEISPVVCGRIPASVEVVLCGDEQVVELRALDFTMKRESAVFAQQTEYDLSRSYRFEVAGIPECHLVEDQSTREAIPFSTEKGKVIVETETASPYLVICFRAGLQRVPDEG